MNPGGEDTVPEPPPSGPPPPPTPMEDWWLVRDSQGKVGWLMSRRLDVDVPDAIAGYAEGQKMVGAYLLRKVLDPESNFPDGLVPEYVTVLNPYQDGLPYDFNQVRVFTWNIKKHRYETAFRQRNLQGYLPVIATQESQTGGAPSFQITQGVGDSVTLDPNTGAAKPASTTSTTYVLENGHVQKAGLEPQAPPRQPLPQADAKRAKQKPGKKTARTKRHKR
jgi:hypothetical protein